MLSRALSLATVMLLISFAAVPVQAQNLEAGKTPSQIFAGGCAVCHKSPRGLLKTVAPGALPGFLRQHYTTSTDMASLLSAYVISNGATDTRFGGGGLTKQGKELTSEQKPAAAPAPADEPSFFGFGRRKREPTPQEAAKPDTAPLQAEAAPRQSRNAKRRARPVPENPDVAKPAAEGEAATAEPAEGARPASQKQKLSKKNRRDREQPPKADTAKSEPKSETKSEAKSEAKTDAPKADTAKPESAPEPVAPKEEASKPVARPTDEARPESRPEPARSEPRPETPLLRADPVPAVTPAPKTPEPDARPVQAETPSSAPTPSAPTYAPGPGPAPSPTAPAAPASP